MLIRPATVADAALLTDLAATTMRQAFGPPHNPAAVVDTYVQEALTQAVLVNELADPRSTFFLVENPAGTPVGYAKMRRHAPPRRLPERNAVELQRIYLLGDHAGQGLGRVLLVHCLDWARRQGYAIVWLGVWERNVRALAFYQKMGFERFGYHYFQFGPDRQRDFWLAISLTTQEQSVADRDR